MLVASKKQMFRYVTLPAIRPRLQSLFFSGFQYIPFFIALVYQTVKLLPANHPYVDPANIGRFGLRQVIAEAANHLEFSRKNADQVVLFFIVLMGLMIAFVQIALIAVSMFAAPVMAAGVQMPNNFAGFFRTAAPEQDIALIMLDLVFGVPDFFHSCVSEAAMCKDVDGGNIARTSGAWILEGLGWPYPIHHALHAMFRVYSLGLLVVATLITCYFIATVALETAQTGTPFGKRFNKLWAPLRLVVAFGLLIPIGVPGAGANAGGYGLNASQYVVLYAAKFGSAFATNGWNIFNQVLVGTTLGQAEDLVSKPNIPELGGILQFLYTASVCAELEYAQSKGERWIRPYVVKDSLSTAPNMVFADAPNFYASYDSIMNFIDGASNIVVRYGIIDEASMNKGKVIPLCGEIIIPLSDPRPPGKAEPGTEAIQRYYVFVLQELWALVFYGGNGGAGGGLPAGLQDYDVNYPFNTMVLNTQIQPNSFVEEPPAEYRSDLQSFYKRDIQAVLGAPGLTPGSQGLGGIVGPNAGAGALQAQKDSGRWDVDATLRSKGWAGAGLWYNRIAELNGSITEAVAAMPTPSRWPDIMEYVRAKKRQQDQNVPFAQRFNPRLANGRPVPTKEGYSPDFAQALWAGFNYWQAGDFATTSHTEPAGNIFMDAINAIFGTEGLYSMRQNPTVHPLAQLTGVGRSLVESSIRNLTFATVGGAGAAVLSTFDQFLGGAAGAASSALLSIVMITLSAGFVLYYIVPFLPFIYFFFAVGGWIKAIFEAMVGAPLWALAHIRIDGNGLPGAAAVNGYFLIFEIFLRPILIIFGLLASISIFGALVSVLNSVWELATANLSGFDVATAAGPGTDLIEFFRGPLDEFFFTVIYAIIVYMMALASFKLIDLIPANILRWMGQSVATENDARENAAESLVGSASVGANQAIQSLGGSLQGALGSINKK